jgi:hypothetical protein
MDWLKDREPHPRRWGRSSVIDPRAMISDGPFDLIGAQIERIARIPNWTPKKQKLRERLEKMVIFQGYIGFEADYRDYHVTRVGQSFLYGVPVRKKGHLAPFSGKRVRIVCIHSGPYRRWVRVGLPRRMA